MKKSLCMAACAALLSLVVAAPAMAQQKKTLAVVVKGLDNPFFTVLGDGCALWNKENPKSEYTCLYTGPASSADEAGEVQIVEDLINKGVAGIAISPSNAPAMARCALCCTAVIRRTARRPRGSTYWIALTLSTGCFARCGARWAGALVV